MNVTHAELTVIETTLALLAWPTHKASSILLWIFASAHLILGVSILLGQHGSK